MRWARRRRRLFVADQEISLWCSNEWLSEKRNCIRMWTLTSLKFLHNTIALCFEEHRDLWCLKLHENVIQAARVRDPPQGRFRITDVVQRGQNGF